MSEFNSCVYVFDADGEEWEIDVRVSYDASYTPSKVSGPPEDCYPEDSEMALTEIETLNDLPPGITEEMVQKAAVDCERLVDEAWEDYHGL